MMHQHQHLHTLGQGGRHQPHGQLCTQIKRGMYLFVKKGGGFLLVGKGHTAQIYLALAALKMRIVNVASHRAAE